MVRRSGDLARVVLKVAIELGPQLRLVRVVTLLGVVRVIVGSVGL